MVSIAKEVELLEREDLGYFKQAQSSCYFSSTSSRGRDSHGRGDSFHYWGVHASLQTLESGPCLTRVQRSMGQGNYNIALGSSQPQSTPISCFRYGGPYYMIHHYPLQTHSGPHRNYSAALVGDSRPPTRGPVPQARDHGRVQSNRGGHTRGRRMSSAMTQSSGGQVTICYIFSGGPKQRP